MHHSSGDLTFLPHLPHSTTAAFPTTGDGAGTHTATPHDPQETRVAKSATGARSSAPHSHANRTTSPSSVPGPGMNSPNCLLPRLAQSALQNPARVERSRPVWARRTFKATPHRQEGQFYRVTKRASSANPRTERRRARPKMQRNVHYRMRESPPNGRKDGVKGAIRATG